MSSLPVDASTCLVVIGMFSCLTIKLLLTVLNKLKIYQNFLLTLNQQKVDFIQENFTFSSCFFFVSRLVDYQSEDDDEGWESDEVSCYALCILIYALLLKIFRCKQASRCIVSFSYISIIEFNQIFSLHQLLTIYFTG